VNLLQESFPRYKAIKACPNNSWNEATLHAMCANGIFYHTASLHMSPAYTALYKSLFDVSSELERERMSTRFPGQLLYYPLTHTDETGEASVYSVDWAVVLSGDTPPTTVIPLLKGHALDWWTPLMVGAHFCLPGSGAANGSPDGWMFIMDMLMDAVSDASYPWRRWVDNYDFARNTERFDRDLAINQISVAGNDVTYDITAGQPIRFMTLRAAKPGYRVGSVTIDGVDYAYFGDDFVHLPEIDGNAVVVVNLIPEGDYLPHVTYVDPSAVIEDARCVDGKLQLTLSGEFAVTANIVGSTQVFADGATQVFDDDTEHLHIGVAADTHTEQVELSLVPSSGRVEAAITIWDPLNPHYRRWTETAYPDPELQGFDDMQVEHIVGDLIPNQWYLVKVDSNPVDTCFSNESGRIYFPYCEPWSDRTIEVGDSVGAIPQPPEAGVTDGDTSEDREHRMALSVRVYPNPPATNASISYQLPARSHVDLGIYSVGGLLVRPLVDDSKPAGRYKLEWDGRDAYGIPVSPGVYFCRLETSAGIRTCKIVMSR
jgi:hypothetical protein